MLCTLGVSQAGLILNFFSMDETSISADVVSERPVMLIVDGHKSHLTLELIDCVGKNR